MLQLNELVKDIQNRLNNSNSTLEFVIFTDMGKYNRAKRKDFVISRKINGIATATGSETTATQAGFDLATRTVKFDFLVRCKDDEEPVLDYDGSVADIGNQAYITQVAYVLNNLAAEQFVGTMLDGSGTSYAYSVAFTLADTGTLEQRSGVGKSIRFSLFAHYNIVQSGVNSRNKQYYLNGNVIPYTSAKAGRKPVIEADVYSGEQVAKSTVTASSFFISLAVPAFIGALTDAVDKFIFGGDIKTHILSHYNAQSQTWYDYFVNFGDSTESDEGVLNVGGLLSFAETKYDKDRTELADGLYTYTSPEGEFTEITFQGTNTVVVYNDSGAFWSHVAPGNSITFTGTIVCTAEKVG